MNLEKNSYYILFGFLITSCGSTVQHYYYVPPPKDATMLVEKNDFNLSGAFAAGDKLACQTIQGAFSPINHLGIKGEYMATDLKYKESGTVNKGQYFSGGMGYYNKFKNGNLPIGFEIYGGFATESQVHKYYSYEIVSSSTSWLFGTINNWDYIYQGHANVMYMQYYFQPAIWYNGKYFAGSFFTRFSLMNYQVNNNVYSTFSAYNELNRLTSSGNFLAIEPGFNFGVGYKMMKIQLQFALSQMMASGIKGDDFSFGVGFLFNYRKAFLKVKSQKPPSFYRYNDF